MKYTVFVKAEGFLLSFCHKLAWELAEICSNSVLTMDLQLDGAIGCHVVWSTAESNDTGISNEVYEVWIKVALTLCWFTKLIIHISISISLPLCHKGWLMKPVLTPDVAGWNTIVQFSCLFGVVVINVVIVHTVLLQEDISLVEFCTNFILFIPAFMWLRWFWLIVCT